MFWTGIGGDAKYDLALRIKSDERVSD